MTEFLELVGPDAIRNLLQNWPFAVVVIGGAYAMFREMVDCHKRYEFLLEKFAQKELDN